MNVLLAMEDVIRTVITQSVPTIVPAISGIYWTRMIMDAQVMLKHYMCVACVIIDALLIQTSMNVLLLMVVVTSTATTLMAPIIAHAMVVGV